jgi:hypothetical protein
MSHFSNENLQSDDDDDKQLAHGLECWTHKQKDMESSLSEVGIFFLFASVNTYYYYYYYYCRRRRRRHCHHRVFGKNLSTDSMLKSSDITLKFHTITMCETVDL